MRTLVSSDVDSRYQKKKRQRTTQEDLSQCLLLACAVDARYQLSTLQM